MIRSKMMKMIIGLGLSGFFLYSLAYAIGKGIAHMVC